MQAQNGPDFQGCGFGQQSIYQVARELKKEQHTLFNCLASILSDAAFIQEIRLLYPDLPLLANLRAGGWYAPNPDGTCYFKSTDGHQNNCNFSVTRLNWHVAELATQKGGAIIVDATRKGKRFPDALSKTIPIWAAVLNRAVARVRAYDAQKAQRRRTYAAADGQVFTAVADTQTTISVRGDQGSAARVGGAAAPADAIGADAAAAPGTAIPCAVRLLAPEADNSRPLLQQPQPQQSTQESLQQQQQQQQDVSAPPQELNRQQEYDQQQQQQQHNSGLDLQHQQHHAQHCRQAVADCIRAAQPSPDSTCCGGGAQVVELLVDCMGPTVDLLSAVDSGGSSNQLGVPYSPTGVPTPEPCTSVPPCMAGSAAATVSAQATGPTCCCMHRSKSAHISPQPSLHEWLDEMDVLRRLALLSDGRASSRSAQRTSCPTGCGCVSNAEVQCRQAAQQVSQQQQQQPACAASAPAASCVLADEDDSAPATPVAALWPRVQVEGDVSVFEAAASTAVLCKASSSPVPAVPAAGRDLSPRSRTARASAQEGISSPAFLLAAAAGEPATPRLMCSSSCSSSSEQGGSIGEAPQGDGLASGPLQAEPVIKQLRFADDAEPRGRPAAAMPADFAFPPPHQLAASAGSSVGAEAAGVLAGSGLASSGSSCGSGMVGLPDMPVVVLNGTSHQPGDAASILDIWRGTDLEDVASLPAISDFKPGVYHMPADRQQQPAACDLSSDSCPWPRAQHMDLGAPQEAGACWGGDGSNQATTSWAAEVCLRSQQQLSGRLSVSNWLDYDDEGGAAGDALCAFAVPALAPSCCSTSGGDTEDAAPSCCSMTCCSQGSGSDCSDDDSRPSSRQSSTTAGCRSAGKAGRLAGGGECDSTGSGCGAAVAEVHAEWDTALHLPLWVSAHERQAIEAKLDGWVERLLEVGADVRGLAAVLTKPLRPLWVSQSSLIWTNQVAQPCSLPFTPLLLVSASQPHAGERQAVRSAWLALARGGPGSPARPLTNGLCSSEESEDSSDQHSSNADDHWEGLGLSSSWGSRLSKQGGAGKRSGGSPGRRLSIRSKPSFSRADSSGGGAGDCGSVSYVYVPGAGDDEESWAAGLTPALFWQHCDALLRCGPSNIKPAVRQLLQLHKSASYGGASASLAAAAVRGPAAAAAPNGSGGCGPARQPSPLGRGSSSHTGAGVASISARGGAVLTDRHHPAPQGCAAAGGAAPTHVLPAAPGAFWIGGTGMAVGNLEGASAADVWRAVDAVLCCGTAMAPVLQREYTAMQLAAASVRPAPVVAVMSSSAPASREQQQQLPGGSSSQALRQRGSQPAPTATPGTGERPVSSSFCTSSSAAHSHWVQQQQQLAAAGACDKGSKAPTPERLEFSKVASGTKKPVRKGGMLSALLNRAAAPSSTAVHAAPGADAAPDAAPPAAPAAAAGHDCQSVCSDASSVAGSEASSAASSSYYSVCSDEAEGACSAAAAGSRAHLPRLKWLPVAAAKRERSSLKSHLQEALEFVSAHLAAGHTVLLHDVEGHDNCVCLAVAVLTGCFAHAAGPRAGASEPCFVGAWNRQHQHQPTTSLPPAPVSKQSVRQQLALVSGCYPLARPTRGMLKQVFNFFEERRRDTAAS